jgi:hypothetical protein
VILFDFQSFDAAVTEATGQRVSLIQRVDDVPPVHEIDEDFLREVDTLIVVSLDHFITEQQPTPAEVQAIQHFLEREDACLIVCPHHNIGAETNQAAQERELRHHGDKLVPPQQRIGGFARALLDALGTPVENQFGLNPARSRSDNGPARLQKFEDLDGLGVLRGVDTFNLHPHLPHLYVPEVFRSHVRVLARQEINPAAAGHPFVEAGNRYFDAMLWIPPNGSRAANIFICDATLWSSAFGGAGSLQQFWLNLARLTPRSV